MNNQINIAFTILLLIMSGCATNNLNAQINAADDHKVREILTGLELADNEYFEYTPEADFHENGVKFSLRCRALYNQDGYIQKLTVYKSEGSLDYSQEDISNDLQILDYYGLPKRQRWRLINGNLTDENGNLVMSVERVTETIYKATGSQRNVLLIIE